MGLDVTYHLNSNVFYRIWDHAEIGLKANIGDRNKTPSNIVEKCGDAILFTVGLIPKGIKAIEKSFQDPRIMTVALTALALFTASLIFYPATTIPAAKATCIALVYLIKQVPFWAVKLSAYIATCATIIGAGLRAEGRFNNSALMKEFYNMPSDYPYNPARLYPSEIAKEKLLTAS